MKISALIWKTLVFPILSSEFSCVVWLLSSYSFCLFLFLYIFSMLLFILLMLSFRFCLNITKFLFLYFSHFSLAIPLICILKCIIILFPLGDSIRFLFFLSIFFHYSHISTLWFCLFWVNPPQAVWVYHFLHLDCRLFRLKFHLKSLSIQCWLHNCCFGFNLLCLSH